MTSTPAAFSSLASATVSSIVQPPAMPSIDDVRKKSGLSCGHCARTARATSSAKRMRPARSPPYSSRARVDDRRQERMRQVAVRAVHFERVEAGRVRARGRRAERGHDALDAALRRAPAGTSQPSMCGIAHRSDDAPRIVAAREIGGAERRVAEPRPLHARLAAGVRELHAGGRAHATARSRSIALDRRDVLVGPQAQVAVRDAPFRQHGGRLGEHEAEAAHRELAEMHEVPVVGEAVLRRVLAHRRDDGAVAQRDVAQLERREQAGLECGQIRQRSELRNMTTC